MAKIMQALLVLAVMSPLLASAKLVILGDSLSDNGVDGILAGTELVNNKFSTGPVNVGTYPPAPYYFGRFTNGFIWVDVAAKILGQEVDNYAAGGSNGNGGEITVDPPFAYVSSPTKVTSRSLVQQAQSYASLNAYAAPTTDTVVIFTGVDEYYQQVGLGSGSANTTDVISSISSALTTAYTAGARDFVVVDLPPLASFPFAGANSNSLGTLASTHNSQLASALTAFNTSNAGAKVTTYNVSSLFSAVIASPANYANPAPFTNVTGACRAGDLDTVQAAGFSTPNCPNGDAYVFWDTVHPSKHMHQVIGQDFAIKTAAMSSAAATS